MAKRHRRKKSQKPKSRMGIWATGLATFSFACCIFVTVVAATTEGESLPSWAGFLALLAMFENFFGLFLSFREIKDEDLALDFRVSGLATTAVMSIVWIFYYLLGLIG